MDVTGRERAFELLEQRVAERTRELEALLEVAHNVTSTLELGPLVSLSHVVQYTGAFVLTLETDALRVLDYRGPVPSERLVGARLPIEHALVSLEERAARIGASAVVRTAPGAGTSVRIEVPV